MRIKRKLTILLVLLACAIVLLVAGGVWIYRSAIAPVFVAQEPPPELREAKVITGADFLARSEFYKADKNSLWRDLLDRNNLKVRWDSFSDLAVAQLDGKPGLDIGLAGRFGMTLLDRQGNVTERINYRFETGISKLGPFKSERKKTSFYQMRVVDLEGDGVCEILASDGLDGASVFSHQGKVLFSRGEKQEGKSSIREVVV